MLLDTRHSRLSSMQLPPKKLLDQVRDAIHLKPTLSAQKKLTRCGFKEMNVPEIEAFLTHLAIAEPVQSSPLAVCDAQTIAPADLVTRELVYRDRIGETYAITYNPAHQWFYFPQMRRDEALLIKCFDSAVDRARFTAHTAFEDPTSAID